MKSFYSLFAVLLSLLFVHFLGAEQPTAGYSRNAPAVFVGEIQPLMTDVRTLLGAAAKADASVSDALVLLDERILWVDDSGKSYDLRQTAYTALNDAAIDEVSEDVFVFRPDEGEKIYLLGAMTILPDGSEVPVHDAGVFVQTPQRDARQRIYSGRKELKIVFPDIRPGVTAYACVLVVGPSSRIEGEVIMSSTWRSGWRQHLQRVILELPDVLAQRLNIASRGQVPQVQRQSLPQGRTRLSLEILDTAPSRYEPLGGDEYDVGPYVKISSLKDWDAFASWYGKQIAGVSGLSPELQQFLETWTHGVESREDIIRTLFERVANDVRYTSVNFGNGGIIPQGCGLVWQNKYGDCKDKANLLRSLLAAKGIRSHLALVNTDHLGQVEKLTPSPHPFTHAIVAVEDGRGDYLFCDPTISFGRPGLLSPRSSDRDVLIVDEAQGRGIWRRTPPSAGGGIAVEFDLGVSAEGSMRGWMTYRCTDVFGAFFMNDYRTSGRNQKEDQVRDLLRAFYRNAQMIDFEHTQPEDWSGQFVLRVYFLLPGALSADSGGATVSLPDVAWLLPRLGRDREITRDAFLYPEQLTVSAAVSLPQGWASQSLPQPIQIAAPGLNAQGSYRVDGGILQFSLSSALTRPRITPAEFPALFNARQSLGTWLAQPVIVRRSEGVAEASAQGGGEPPAVVIGAADFPVMPTPRGQLELALKRFPAQADMRKARQALEAVVQYFPNEDAVVFEARMSLAAMDWKEGKETQSLAIIDELLATYSHTLSAENIGWANYVKGMNLADLGRMPEALEIFRVLAQNGELSALRRAWAEHLHGKYTLSSHPQEALAGMRRAFELGGRDEPVFFRTLVQTLLEHKRKDELLALLQAQLQDNPEYGRDLLVALLTEANRWSGQPGLSAAASDVLGRLGARQILGDEYAASLDSLERSVRSFAEAQRFREQLTRYIADNPPVFWSGTTPAAELVSREDFQKAANRFSNGGNTDSALRHVIELLLRFEPDADFYESVWEMMAYANLREQNRRQVMDERLLDDLLNMGVTIPKYLSEYLEVLFLRASYFERRGNYNEQMAVYREIETFNNPNWRSPLALNMGRVAEKQGDYDLALSIYSELLPLQQQGKVLIPETLLRAMFIHLSRSEREQALPFLHALGRFAPGDAPAPVAAQLIGEMIRHGKQEQLLVDYWQRWKTWWPKWEAFARAIGVDADAVNPARVSDLIVLDPLYDELSSAHGARDVKRMAAALARLADAARWQPDRIDDLLRINVLVQDAFPQHVRLWRELTLAMYESGADMSPGRWAGASMLWYGVNLYDLGRVDAAQAMLDAFYKQNREADEVTYSMNRLQALVAISRKKGLAEAARRLEDDLKQEWLGQRAFSVIQLQKLYDAMGDLPARLALLARELENPETQADGKSYQKLRSIYNELQREAADGNKLREAVSEWLAQYGPGWLDYARPESLEADRLKAIVQGEDSFDDGYTAVEAAKRRLIAPMSEQMDAQARANTFILGVLMLVAYNDSPQRWYQGVDALAPDQRFDEHERARLAFMSVFWAQQIGDVQRVREVYENRESYAFSPIQLENLESLHETLDGLDINSADSLYARALALHAKGALGILGTQFFTDAFDSLLRMGEIERAQELHQRFVSVRAGEDGVARMKSGMEQLRAIRRVRELQPFHDAMRAGALKLLQANGGLPAPQPQGEALWCIFTQERMDILPQQERWRQLGRMVGANHFSRTDISFWIDFGYAYLRLHPARSRDIVTLYGAGLEAVADDRTRARLLVLLILSVDYDDPAIQQAVEPLLARWRDDDASPVSRDTIRAEDLRLLARTGRNMDEGRFFGKISHPLLPNSLIEDVLSYYYIRGNKEELKRELNKLSGNEMAEPSLAPVLIRSFEYLEMADELELIRRSAREMVYQNVLTGWSQGDVSAAFSAVTLATALGESSLIPKGFRDYFAAVGNEHVNMEIASDLAALDENWPLLEEKARQVVAVYPEHYDYQWQLGLALYKQGRLAEAVAPLSLFVRYAGNSLDIPTAKQWLRQAEAAVAKP